MDGLADSSDVPSCTCCMCWKEHVVGLLHCVLGQRRVCQALFTSLHQSVKEAGAARACSLLIRLCTHTPHTQTHVPGWSIPLLPRCSSYSNDAYSLCCWRVSNCGLFGRILRTSVQLAHAGHHLRLGQAVGGPHKIVDCCLQCASSVKGGMKTAAQHVQ